MARDLARELDQWDGCWPDAWRAAEGKTLIGKVLRYSTGQSSFGEVRTVIIEEDDGNRVSLWLSSEVLRCVFEKERPKVGERIGLKCHGKHPEKHYWRFSLIVDREEQEPVFSPLGGERGDDGADDESPFAGEEHPYLSATSRPARPRR